MKHFFGEKKGTLSTRKAKKRQKAMSELESMEMTIPSNSTDKKSIRKSMLRRAIAATLAAGTMLTITGCSSKESEEPTVDTTSGYTDEIKKPSVDITAFDIEYDKAFSVKEPDDDALYGYFQIVKDYEYKRCERHFSSVADQQGNEYESIDEPLYLSQDDLMVCYPYYVRAESKHTPYIKLRSFYTTSSKVLDYMSNGSIVYLGYAEYNPDDPYNWRNAVVKSGDGSLTKGYAAIDNGVYEGGKVEQCTDVDNLVVIVTKDTKLLTRDQVIEREKNHYKDYKIITPDGRRIRISPGISDYNLDFRITDESGVTIKTNIEIPYGGIIKIDEKSEPVEKNGFIWRKCRIKYNDKIVEGYVAAGKEDGSTYIQLVPEEQEQSHDDNEERE